MDPQQESSSSPGEVTQLLLECRNGNRNALERLVPLVYDELRQLAASYLRRERPEHTLQPTALVHEAYVRLVGQRNINWQHRSHFFGVAAHLMRLILVDHARARRSGKRGGGLLAVPADDVLDLAEHRDLDVIALDDALSALARLDEQQSRIVELRYFGGLSVEETAEALGVSTPTVKRDWAVAKLWMRREILRGRERDG
jgi:RNA polymerase sigma factor (TIGR02999 family)